MDRNFAEALKLVLKHDQEEWRPIPAYPGYEASTFGRIRSLKRGRVKVLAAAQCRGGYLRVTLSVGGVVSTRPVHRLVLLAFAGHPRPGQHGAHNNGVRDDNRPDNLRWATPKENIADRVRHGTAAKFEQNPRAVLTRRAVAFIRENYIAGTGRCNPGNSRELAARFNVTTQSIRYAAQGKTWQEA